MNFFSTLNGITNFKSDLAIMIALGLCTLITVFVLVYILAISVGKPDSPTIGKMKVSGVATILIIIGLAIRVVFITLTNGYMGTSPTGNGGLNSLYNAVHSIFQYGFGGAESYAVKPVPLYLATLFGSIAEIFGSLTPNNPTMMMQILFRLPMILADIVSAIVLYKIAKKYSNSQIALAMAGIYMLCPIFFFSSGIWGSVFSILALFLLLSLYFMTQKKFAKMIACYSLAILTSNDALYLLPIFGVFVVYYFIKSLNAAKERESSSFKTLLADPERGLIIRIPLYIVLSLVLMYVIQLPLLGGMNYNFGSWFMDVFISPFTEIPFISNNALAIYNIFGRNNMEMGDSIPAFIYSLIFAILAVSLVVIVYTSKKNRANMVLIAAYLVFTLSVFFMGFSELNLVPVLVMLLLSFVLIKDKRILHVFGIVALTVTLNATAVMMQAGYLSNLAMSDFAGSLYTGTTMLRDTTFGNIMNIICTGITILSYVYLTLILLDISLTYTVKPFAVKDNTFGGAMKDWFTFRR